LRLLILLTAVWAGLALSKATSVSAVDTADDLHRGDYITHHLAMCVECHTPRDDHGALIVLEEFKGAPIPVENPGWAKDWAARSANIRGLPGWNEKEAIFFLETGHRLDGREARRPMPPFRMVPDDARAVVAYLKSLR
jgi:mono/diheme cytochrome c family protein